MVHYIPLVIRIAQKHTLESANVPAWRLSRKRDRRMQEVARSLAAGKGYIIATPAELHAAYPDLAPPASGPDTNRVFIWAIGTSLRLTSRDKYDLHFVTI